MPDGNERMKISTVLGEAFKAPPAANGMEAKPYRDGPKISRMPAGSFDGINGRLVEGWVIDERTPSLHLTVQVFDDDRLLGETIASLFRQDLLDANVGDGCHSFRFILPLELFDGRSHRIVARVGELDFELNGSPKVLDTSPLPIEQAFPFQPAVTTVAPPLTDVQFTMLRALTAMSEMMVAQGKVLGVLAEQIGRFAADSGRPPLADGAALAGAALAPVAPPAQPYGPLLPVALARPRGRHDYLFFSVIDWDFRIQRPQHLAREMAALGSRVFYVSKTFEEFAGRERFRVTAQPADGVFEITLRCRAPLPNIYAGIIEEWQIADLSAALAEAAAMLRLHCPVGVVQFPSWYPVAVCLPGMLMVHDCLDQVAGFNNVSPMVVAQEEQMIRNADCVVVMFEYPGKICRQAPRRRDGAQCRRR